MLAGKLNVVMRQNVAEWLLWSGCPSMVTFKLRDEFQGVINVEIGGQRMQAMETASN